MAGLLKRTIAVDLDEVLGGFLPALISFHNDKYGSTLALKDLTSGENLAHEQTNILCM